jgi:hypothetical protein
MLTVEDMQRRFVQVETGRMVVDLANPRRKLSLLEFHAAYAHCKFTVGKDVYYCANEWAESPARKQVHCLTFDPEHGPFFTTEDGLKSFNLWDAPKWPEEDPELAAPLIEHVEYLFPDKESREWFLDYLAHARQRPWERPTCHPLHVTTMTGTGRGSLGLLLAKLWGRHAANEVDLYSLLDPRDQFRSTTLTGKVMIICPEVRAPAEERFGLKERMRTFFDQKSWRINEKNEKRWDEKACARVFMASNNEDALPLNEFDRRVYVIDGPSVPKPKAYYTAFHDRLKDPRFLGAVWTWLARRDISAFNPGMRAPMTALKQTMIASSRSTEQLAVIRLVEACPYDVIASPDLMLTAAPPDMREISIGMGDTKEVPAETTAQRTARTRPLEAVLRDAGYRTYPKTLKIGGQMRRVWILRNRETWSNSSLTQLRDEALKAQRDLIATGYDLAGILEKWEPEAGEAVVDAVDTPQSSPLENAGLCANSRQPATSTTASNTTTSTASTTSSEAYREAKGR